MNYKKISSLLLILLIAGMAYAQKPAKANNIAVWKISYHLDFGSPERQQEANTTGSEEQSVMMELAKALSGSSEDRPPLTCYVNENYLRIEQNGLGGGITLADKRDTSSYSLDTLNKTAIRYPAEIPNLQTQVDGDSLVVISSDDFKMELKNETMTIAGQLCRKAIFTNPEQGEQTITVWYAAALPRLYWQKYSYLKNIPGCALSIGTVSKGLNVGIKAGKIEKVNTSESFFQPPADYEITEGMF